MGGLFVLDGPEYYRCVISGAQEKHPKQPKNPYFQPVFSKKISLKQRLDNMELIFGFVGSKFLSAEKVPCWNFCHKFLKISSFWVCGAKI